MDLHALRFGPQLRELAEGALDARSKQQIGREIDAGLPQRAGQQRAGRQAREGHRRQRSEAAQQQILPNRNEQSTENRERDSPRGCSGRARPAPRRRSAAARPARPQRPAPSARATALTNTRENENKRKEKHPETFGRVRLSQSVGVAHGRQLLANKTVTHTQPRDRSRPS